MDGGQLALHVGRLDADELVNGNVPRSGGHAQQDAIFTQWNDHPLGAEDGACIQLRGRVCNGVDQGCEIQ